MRRILFPLLVIGLAAGLFTLGSGAFFSDVEEDTDNAIAAGTLDLEVSVPSEGTCTFLAIAPGQATGDCEKLLSLLGNLDNLTLYVSLSAEHLACNPDGANDSTQYCDETADLSTGNLNVSSCSFDGGACPFGAGATLAEFEDCVELASGLGPDDDGLSLLLAFEIDSSVGNPAQGDAIGLAFTFYLQQAEDDSPCVGV